MSRTAVTVALRNDDQVLDRRRRAELSFIAEVRSAVVVPVCKRCVKGEGGVDRIKARVLKIVGDCARAKGLPAPPPPPEMPVVDDAWF